MSKITIPTDEEADDSFSTVRIFSFIKEKIRSINKYPLTTENLVVQQDQYQKLSLTDGEYDPDVDWVTFAVLECSRKQRDTDLRFTLELAGEGFVLDAEGIGEIIYEYGDIADNEEEVAEQVVTVIRLLANGQLAGLITKREGRVCASETLLYEKDERLPVAIGTVGEYPWWWKASDSSGYETEVLINSYLEEKIALPEKLFLFERNKNGKIRSFGRIISDPYMKPLTKEMYNLLMPELGLRLIGKEVHGSDWSVFYRSWEFWLFAILLATLLVIGVDKGFLPQIIGDYPVLMMPVLIILTYAIVIPLLRRKEVYREKSPDHPWVRLDNLINSYSKPVASTVLSLGYVVVSFMPVFNLGDSGQPVNNYIIAQSHPTAYILPLLFVPMLISSRFVGRFWSKPFFWSIFVGSALNLVINISLSKADAVTPEPYGTFAVALFILAPFVAFFLDREATVFTGKSEEQLAKDGLEISQRSLNIMRSVQVAICYASVPIIFWAALVFKNTLPDGLLFYITPTFAFTYFVLVSAWLLTSTVYLHIGRIGSTKFNWNVLGIFIGVMGWMGISKDYVKGGPNSPWILLVVIMLILGIVTAIKDAVETNLKKKELFS